MLKFFARLGPLLTLSVLLFCAAFLVGLGEVGWWLREGQWKWLSLGNLGLTIGWEGLERLSFWLVFGLFGIVFGVTGLVRRL